jgi:glyoxylase I family protein
MAVPFTVVGIDHVVLRAADPKTLERFYLDALGLRFADEAGPAGGTSSTGGVNLDHLCLRVEPFNGAAIAKHLAAQDVACGAETLRYGAEGNGPSIYLRDPEGNGVELKAPATDR